MSGPPNVGSGVLSRIARKNSPSTPKWRNIEAKLCPRFGGAFWIKTFSMGNKLISLDCFRNWHCAFLELCRSYDTHFELGGGHSARANPEPSRDVDQRDARLRDRDQGRDGLRYRDADRGDRSRVRAAEGIGGEH